jgi:hypothetical protein
MRPTSPTILPGEPLRCALCIAHFVPFSSMPFGIVVTAMSFRDAAHKIRRSGKIHEPPRETTLRLIDTFRGRSVIRAVNSRSSLSIAIHYPAVQRLFVPRLHVHFFRDPPAMPSGSAVGFVIVCILLARMVGEINACNDAVM